MSAVRKTPTKSKKGGRIGVLSLRIGKGKGREEETLSRRPRKTSPAVSKGKKDPLQLRREEGKKKERLASLHYRGEVTGLTAGKKSVLFSILLELKEKSWQSVSSWRKEGRH